MNIVIIGLGLALILVSFVLAVLFKNSGEFAMWIVRVMVALGAGFASGGLLGNLELSGPIFNTMTISASGGFAVFVLVYAFNPASRLLQRG
jgi:hypothetical protein